MIICGIKLTHDGAIALIDNGKLIFSYEMEKIANSARHAKFFLSMANMNEILAEHGYSPNSVDRIVIDGWDGWDEREFSGGEAEEDFYLEIPAQENQKLKIKVADYGHIVKADENILKCSQFRIQELGMAYNSYMHVSSHVSSAYCTSPFPGKGEDSYILVWDGGMPPQLFYYKYRENTFMNLGYLFLFGGYMYIRFAYEYEPFCQFKYGLEIAGKVMAYIAIGNVIEEVLVRFREIFDGMNIAIEDEEVNMRLVDMVSLSFVEQAKKLCIANQVRHQDMLATFHAFVQQQLVHCLEKKVKKFPQYQANLCFAGGSALNIKWNNALRESGIFREVWVPPFPNDAGSAIGTACCEMLVNDSCRALEWDVYSGPVIHRGHLEQSDYSNCECGIEELAFILHKYGEPIVFLHGAAELGPRALGNRSILAPASVKGMKSLLNKIKGREDYRPVAPICLEADAPGVFDPGSPDPFMLYEHMVKPEWKDKVAAICHLDGSARLQTVNSKQNKFIFQLLTHYKRLSGIPLLCNTSANFNGKGFFPDVASAMAWGKVNFIWSEGYLFFRETAGHPLELYSKEIAVK